jgi:hypothetical protein
MKVGDGQDRMIARCALAGRARGWFPSDAAASDVATHEGPAMNPLQTELLARERVASALRLASEQYPRPEPRPLPPRRRPLVWPGALAARATRLVARARAVAGAVAAGVPVLQLAV